MKYQFDVLSCKLSNCFLAAYQIWLSGGTGGIVLWLVTFPIDVVKTRIQVLSSGTKLQGFFWTFRHIIRTEGLHKTTL